MENFITKVKRRRDKEIKHQKKGGTEKIVETT